MNRLQSVLFTGLFAALAVALMSAGLSNALDCYVCSSSESYQDTSCVDNSGALKVLNCSKKYCVTVRKELRRNSSKVVSFSRGCEDVPEMLYGNIPDENFRTYYTSCQKDLCNGHNGRIKNSTSGTGAIHNAIVPGKNAGHIVLFWPYSLLLATLLPLFNK
ncbi:uncharacterized protein LOC110180475 [Drosophila serrata]|uniref:uncharacterized protein LOC110180475 n=1 Tax=Drosophila serrata TaxID=7274 RepID=UPI000A1CF9A6|nr:uncharacterized protein LOC110180475 [Drosophila serrata]